MSGDYELQDSGERKEYVTGAVRDKRKNKGRFELVTPIGLRRVAIVYEKGAVKYNPRNWEKGIPIGRFLDSAIRHIYQHIEGLRDEDHLAQAAWNLLGAIHTDEMIRRGLLPKELDNLPNFMPKEK